MYIVAFELSEPSSNAPDVLPVRIALARRAFDSDHSKSNYDDLASSLFFCIKMVALLTLVRKLACNTLAAAHKMIANHSHKYPSGLVQIAPFWAQIPLQLLILLIWYCPKHPGRQYQCLAEQLQVPLRHAFPRRKQHPNLTLGWHQSLLYPMTSRDYVVQSVTAKNRSCTLTYRLEYAYWVVRLVDSSFSE